MSPRAFVIAAVCVAFAPVTVCALPLAPMSGPGIVVRVAAPADPTGAHAAIAEAQERLAEIDATITAFQQSADMLNGAARQQAHDALEALRTIRETDRKEIDAVIAKGRDMTADQVSLARAALTAPWTQFEQALDRDVAALKLDAVQRKTLIEARIKAEQSYWQRVIVDLQSSVADLTAEQRAAIDARIERAQGRIDQAQQRLTKLAHASQSAWSALKQGLATSRQIFDDAYHDAH